MAGKYRASHIRKYAIRYAAGRSPAWPLARGRSAIQLSISLRCHLTARVPILIGSGNWPERINL